LKRLYSAEAAASVGSVVLSILEAGGSTSASVGSAAKVGVAFAFLGVLTEGTSAACTSQR